MPKVHLLNIDWNISFARILLLTVWAIDIKTSSPIECPNLSLKDLNLSISNIEIDNGLGDSFVEL